MPQAEDQAFRDLVPLEDLTAVQDALDTADAAHCVAARTSFPAFLTYVIREERTGARLKLAPHQREWSVLLDEYPKLVLMAHIESAKALALWTPIPTPGGWRTMGDLAVGDAMFDRRGTKCHATHATPTMLNHRVYRVRFDDGTEIIADAEHNWIAASMDDVRPKQPPSRKHSGNGPPCGCGCGLGVTHHRTYGWRKFVQGHPGRTHLTSDGWRVITTEQMLARGVTRAAAVKRKDGGAYHNYVWRIPVAEAVEYSARALPIHPYVLGAWLGDGTSTSASFTGTHADRFIYDRCQQFEPSDRPIRQSKTNPNVFTATLGGRSKKFVKDGKSINARLRALGLLGNKHIPEQYLRAGIEQRFELLAGLLDTDGHAGKNGRVVFTSKWQHLADQVTELARSLGFKVSQSSRPSQVNGRIVGTAYAVRFTAGVPVFHLPRKRAMQPTNGQVFGRAKAKFIVAIEQVESEPVRCIAVDSPDHSYLCGRSYTVTHNTSLMNIARTLFELGQNHELRFILAGSTIALPEKVARSVRRYIESSDALHRVFPGLRKGTPWGESAFNVEREADGNSKDYSVQCVGIGGHVLGTRADRIIGDDLIDYDNSRTPHRRQEVINWWNADVFGRLDAKGRAWMLGTAWNPGPEAPDLLHWLEANGWTTKRYAVLDANGNPRWPERWPMERIKQFALDNPLEYRRQLFCEARDESAARFKKEWIERCQQRGADKRFEHHIQAVPPGCRTYTGVDLAASQNMSADLTCLFTILLHPNEDREVLCIESGRWTAPEIVERIIDTHQRYLSTMIVESNGQQAYITQFLHGRSAVPVKPFLTTAANKFHHHFGVEGVAVEMANGKWIIPSLGGADKETRAWIGEMLFYSPDKHMGDRLASSWFAREGARKPTAKVTGNVRIPTLRR